MSKKFKKKVLIAVFIAIVFIIILSFDSIIVDSVYSFYLFAYPKKIATKEQAVNLFLQQKSQFEQVTAGYSQKCIFYRSGEEGNYFLVEIHEKRSKLCPPAEGIMHLVASFRVNKINGEIDEYNIIHDRYDLFSPPIDVSNLQFPNK